MFAGLPLRWLCLLYEIIFCFTVYENIFQWKKVPDMILRKLFNSRLGSACSHLAALLFKLQACSMMDSNKVAYTSKWCAWKKSWTQANPAPLSAINFRRPKKMTWCPLFQMISKYEKLPFQASNMITQIC